MRRVLSAELMRKCDAETIEMLNGNGTILMEHAGTACTEKLFSLFKEELKNKKVLCIAGRGNNGGDAIVVARQLVSKSVNTELILLSEREKYSGDALFQLKLAENYPLKISVLERGKLVDFLEKINQYQIIVDGIFGTGLSRKAEGFYAELIEGINENFKGFVLSVDIPSGLFADSGEKSGVCIKADCTVTFGKIKPCHVLYPARDYCGEVVENDITIPDFVFEGKNYFFYVEKEDIGSLKKHFPPDSHKGDFGHVGIIGGEKSKLGASVLAAYSALKGGCGLSTIMLEEEKFSLLPASYPEIMYFLCKNKADGQSLEEFLKGKDAVLMGQGLGIGDYQRETIKKVLEKTEVPVVLDADVFKNYGIKELTPLIRDKEVVLTPHPGEMIAFTSFPKKEVLKNRIETAKKVAEETGAVVVLKGYQTVVASKEKLYVSGTGSSALGTAGSGDVLGGFIASLLAQGYSLEDAAVLGVVAHGYAGEIAEKELGREGVVASSVAEYLPFALKD